MSEYAESHGPSLKKSRQLEHEKNLHHLRLYGAASSTPEEPRWLVEHHSSEHDSRPESHEFSDPHALLAHIANHSSMPEPTDDEGGK